MFTADHSISNSFILTLHVYLIFYTTFFSFISVFNSNPYHSRLGYPSITLPYFYDCFIVHTRIPYITTRILSSVLKPYTRNLIHILLSCNVHCYDDTCTQKQKQNYTKISIKCQPYF